MKPCKTCGVTKSFDSYHKDKSKKDGFRNICKECAFNSHKVWVESNKSHCNEHAMNSYNRRKEEIANRRRELRQSNPEKYREQRKKTRSKNIEYYRQKSRETSWKNAGIKNMTYAIYETMLKSQNYSCAICHTPQELLSRNLDVDHDHSTGEVRGLLCVNCNRGVGHFKEKESLFLSALNYLKKYD